MSQSRVVTNAELRRAMEKLSIQYIKSTAKTGDVLFGDKKGSVGMIGAEMEVGYSAADMTKSAINSEATGMAISGAFSVAAGCAAMAGGGMEAGSIGEEASAASSVDSVADSAADPASQAVTDITPAETQAGNPAETGPETADGDGLSSRTELELERMEETETDPETDGSTGAGASDDGEPSDEISLRQREEAREETSRTEAASREEDAEEADRDADVEVQDANERPSTEARREEMIRTKTAKARKKQAMARAFTMASGAINGFGSIAQAQMKQEQGTQQARAQVLQTQQQAINTSSQIAQKFYGDLQQGITAAGQTMDLVNQTVVASSRI